MKFELRFSLLERTLPKIEIYNLIPKIFIRTILNFDFLSIIFLINNTKAFKSETLKLKQE